MTTVSASAAARWSLTEGELAKLRCKLDGQPLPHVAWYFNDRPIEPGSDDARYTIISDFREFIVMLPRPALDMAGRYTAVATNRHGQQRMSTTLNVEGRPRLFLFTSGVHPPISQ